MGGPRAWLPPPSPREDAPIHLPQCKAQEEEIWTMSLRYVFAPTAHAGEVERCEALRRRGCRRARA